MNATCPSCGTTYRLDPAKIPAGGVRARCIRCEGVFRVEPEDAGVAPPAHRADAEPTPPPAPAPSPAPAPAFGVADPQGRARRLARALVSDIVVYHPERRDESLRRGTLRQEFRDEIRKSWEEYVAQVGEALARGTPYFREALNEILADGEAVF